eukprot:162578-Pyramimonas_sp.AAC.1
MCIRDSAATARLARGDGVDPPRRVRSHGRDRRRAGVARRPVAGGDAGGGKGVRGGGGGRGGVRSGALRRSFGPRLRLRLRLHGSVGPHQAAPGGHCGDVRGESRATDGR